MKTDWHRYNLKRRVAGLPSVSSDAFAEKFLLHENFEDDQEDEYGFVVYSKRRDLSNRQMTKKEMKRQAKMDRGRILDELEEKPLRDLSPAVSESSHFSLQTVESLTTEGSHFESHSESGLSEYEIVDAPDSDSSSESEDEDSFAELLPLTTCFYCGKRNQDIEPNINHMFKWHGLYIPERSFLTDLHGLLTFLSTKISIDKECIICGFQGKNLTSIRQHCCDKKHCFLPFDGRDEHSIFVQFYQFSSDEPLVALPKLKKTVTFQEEGEPGPRLSRRSNPVSVRAVDRSASSDRRVSGGLTLKQATKADSQMQKQEVRCRNLEIKRGMKKGNFQKHYRDTILGT